MLTTVKGTYQNGVVRLDEPVAATNEPARPVLVVFLEPAPATTPVSAPVSTPRFSWDEALALSAGTSHVSVADEVVAERQERD
ncbi:hypothetical protein [uncultured Hymenobacter sp.]|uniref:hypothetical protein n=1 Tax=uncultured Hymenobacter sp. TaxID=170016 RepID=UPI0035CC362A